MTTNHDDTALFRLIAFEQAADAAFEALSEDEQNIDNYPLLRAHADAIIGIVKAPVHTAEGLVAKLPYAKRFFTENESPDLLDAFLGSIESFARRQATTGPA